MTRLQHADYAVSLLSLNQRFQFKFISVMIGRISFILSAICQLLIAMPCHACDEESYNMESYKVDSANIHIINKQLGYKLLFELNKSQMRCHVSDMLTDKAAEREIVLPDSAEVYSGIKDFMIEDNKNRFDYISERPEPADQSPISMQEDYVARVYTELYINGAVFVNYFYIGDIYSGKEQGVVEWMVIHSEPFRRFMQKLEKELVGELGGDMGKRYNKMIKDTKRNSPEDVLVTD